MSQASQVSSVLIKDKALSSFEGILKPFVRTILTVQFSEKSTLCAKFMVQESFAFHAWISPCSPKQAGLQQDSLDIWLNWSQWLMSLF